MAENGMSRGAVPWLLPAVTPTCFHQRHPPHPSSGQIHSFFCQQTQTRENPLPKRQIQKLFFFFFFGLHSMRLCLFCSFWHGERLPNSFRGFGCNLSHWHHKKWFVGSCTRSPWHQGFPLRFSPPELVGITQAGLCCVFFVLVMSCW